MSDERGDRGRSVIERWLPRPRGFGEEKKLPLFEEVAPRRKKGGL
jgi:hypothetical protein